MKKRTGALLVPVMMLVISLMTGTGTFAADQTARLKAFIESSALYYSTSIESLKAELGANPEAFEDKYEDRDIVISGVIADDPSSSGDREVYLYSSGESVKIKTSAKTVKTLFRQRKSGDSLTVYGRIENIKKDSFSVKAERAVLNSAYDLATDTYVYFEDDSVGTLEYRDLTTDGHVVVRVPDSWNSRYVKGELKNNGVRGRSFFLNAIPPQNREYAENFYIFYFDYLTYLDPVHESYTKGDREDIEELIIRNIVGEPETSLKIRGGDIMVNGIKLDYCSTRYTVGDKTYRLEFLFKPDANKGLICMLYLYYAREDGTSHVKEAAYLASTIEN